MSYPGGPQPWDVKSRAMNGPGTAPPPVPQAGAVASAPPPPRNRSGWIVAVVAVTALLSAALGAGIGAAVGSKTSDNASNSREGGASTTPPNPSAADTHAQDLALCTKYAIVNASLPKGSSDGAELLPAAAVLENSLLANPSASTEIRSALAAVVDNYYRSSADTGQVRTRGLAEPPKYDLDHARAVYSRAWDVCGLGQS
ncbi:MAG: hypothetical protein K0U78_21200 [Actinomycetia bacterium]|nr:hypothetical protein [Actinomycetes bacterium]